jgi:hypothetical protein
MRVMPARVVLITVFLVGLAVQSGAIIFSYSETAIASGDLTNLLTKLLAVYSVHLAVIFGGIFAQQQEGKSPQVPAMALWVAVALAVIWNLLLAWRSITFALAATDPSRDDSVGRLMSYIETISSTSSFLVAGALSFFFTKN